MAKGNTKTYRTKRQNDTTCGNGSAVFQILFLLAANRYGKVSEFYDLSPANEIVSSIVFSRNLLSNQKSKLEALFTLLHHISIQPFVDDIVTWKPTESSTYSTIMAYEVLQQSRPSIHKWFRFIGTKVFLQKSKALHG
ncbi:hypothetical protein CTI12_AA121060 [Artemisia annua]|uniref:Uncharacterized protein n=1 Tax=Artemisia annua TaxID=35608 RepID=A0A2U1PQA3_ARTAN|nr:hypothetical protein CTI12_AA121060 [Artemisia annua]